MSNKRPAFTCGFRKVGLYLVEGSLDSGLPVEIFIPCPPAYVDMEALGLAKTGVQILKRPFSDVYDVWDFVSFSDNPCPADFIEQTREFGTSRLISEMVAKSDKFKLLKADPFDPNRSSRHIYVHAHAIMEYPEHWYRERIPAHLCPAEIVEHDDGTRQWEMCAGLWWEDVRPRSKEPHRGPKKIMLPRNWKELNTDPSCSYYGFEAPEGAEHKYLPGTILSVPIEKIEIPADTTEDRDHERLFKLLNTAGWQYQVDITPD